MHVNSQCLDAEHMFSPQMVDFMQQEGYHFEATYLRAIGNWRQACDQRGLSELQRCWFNDKFLNYILDDLMPWHRTIYDFSLLEVNWYVMVIRFLQLIYHVALTLIYKGMLKGSVVSLVKPL